MNRYILKIKTLQGPLPIVLQKEKEISSCFLFLASHLNSLCCGQSRETDHYEKPFHLVRFVIRTSLICDFFSMYTNFMNREYKHSLC